MASESEDSVSRWLVRLKQGDTQAAQVLWRGYVEQLIRVANKTLRNVPRRAADAEDVVVAAFASFYRSVQEGRFPRLDDRDELWQVLVMLTERKATDHIRRELAARRGGGKTRGDSVWIGAAGEDSVTVGFSQVAGVDPTPEFAAEVADELRHLMNQLPDDKLREIAQYKLEGYTNQEIAEQLTTSLRSVERGLKLVRRIWKRSITE